MAHFFLNQHETFSNFIVLNLTSVRMRMDMLLKYIIKMMRMKFIRFVAG